MKRNKTPRKIVLSLYQRFALLMILAGILPMLILSTFIANHMVENYRIAIEDEYRQATGYISNSLQTLLGSYNTILKLPYSYDMPTGEISASQSFDNFRQMLDRENGNGQFSSSLEDDMNIFLKYVANVDSNIYAVHFVGRDSSNLLLDFHYSNYSTYFRGITQFLEQIRYDSLDQASNELILIPPHSFSYFGHSNETVVTLARNYFDLRGEVGTRTYVGTLFLDIRIQRLSALIQTAHLHQDGSIYIVNGQGECFYSPESEYIGQNIAALFMEAHGDPNNMVVTASVKPYDLQVVEILDTRTVFEQIWVLQRMMYVILLVSALLILFGSVYLSRRLVNPIHEMIRQMGAIEHGNFDIQLQVQSEDEIGILSRRFNQMSQELKTYINQSYIAKIKQTEAELTALRSQIYPHFLYNTLEVIRMTAQEEGNAAVPEMIEALSEQIHYLIGPVQDLVPLEKEFDIVSRYVYLLNCRVRQQIQLTTRTPEEKGIVVPRLILQPIVENAYVHGIKGMENGSIHIEAEIAGDTLEITVMDNGVGISSESMQQLHELLDGDAPGIRNQNDWQSIGLKNVHDRLRFLFGEEYGADITSTPGVGTMIRLTMPRCHRKDIANENDFGR